jgi:hypothetical protein
VAAATELSVQITPSAAFLIEADTSVVLRIQIAVGTAIVTKDDFAFPDQEFI